MIKPKEYFKNKHLTDFPEIKEAVITNHIGRMRNGLRSTDKSDQNMLKDF